MSDRPSLTDSISLTDRDRDLLRLLMQDSRQTVSRLAQSLGLSRPTVQNMLGKLENLAIDRYTVRLKPDFATASIRAFILMKRDPKKSDAITGALRAKPQVTRIYTIIGDYDMLIEIESDNYRILDQLLTDIVVLDGVAHTHTYIVLAEKYAK